MAGVIANAVMEGLPKVFGIVAGSSSGSTMDPSFGPRNAVLIASSVVTEMMTQNANRESLVELDHLRVDNLG